MIKEEFNGYIILHDGKHYITPHYKHTKIYNEIPSQNAVKNISYGRRKATVVKVKIEIVEIVREDTW